MPMEPQQTWIDVTIPMKLSLDRIRDALSGAILGSAYWASEWTPAPECAEAAFARSKDGDYDACVYAATIPGMASVLTHDDPHDDTPWAPGVATRTTITWEAVVAGIRTMQVKYPEQFFDLLMERDDAETHDVLLQCIVFDDLIFS